LFRKNTKPTVKIKTKKESWRVIRILVVFEVGTISDHPPVEKVEILKYMAVTI